MKSDDETQSHEHDAGDLDEVEILEVVGLDEDAAAPPAGLDRSSERPAEPDADELVLSFDEGTPGASEMLGDGPGGVQRSADEPLEQRTDQGKWVRLRADYDNLRKRFDRERREFEVHANSNLVAQILPVLDNFERALAMRPEACSGKAFREGVALIYRQLTDELRREGLTAIEAVGRPFDPYLHDAVATDATPGRPANTVVEELQRGYLFQNRLLRPAMVRVSTNGAETGTAKRSGEES